MSIASISQANNYCYFPSLDQNPIVSAIEDIFARYHILTVCTGLAQSLLFRTTVLTGLRLQALFLLVPNPAQWLIATCVIASIALNFNPPDLSFRYLEFECTAPFRLLFPQNYAEIRWENQSQNQARIFIGAIPNRLRGTGEILVDQAGISVVLSVNEPWEREPQFLSVPYSDHDWQQLGVMHYHKIDVVDHAALTHEQKHTAADIIHGHIQAGRAIFVHCRAGWSRSARAIAAYLIKYQGKSAIEAAAIIKNCRPCSSIYSNLAELEAFERAIRVQT